MEPAEEEEGETGTCVGGGGGGLAHTLAVRVASAEDLGEYACVANNKMGSSEMRAHIAEKGNP